MIVIEQRAMSVLSQSELELSRDRDTGQSFWAKAFILHMMIVPWEKKNPIDFG